MQRRSFFAAALGGVASLLGLKAAKALPQPIGGPREMDFRPSTVSINEFRSISHNERVMKMLRVSYWTGKPPDVVARLTDAQLDYWCRHIRENRRC